MEVFDNPLLNEAYEFLLDNYNHSKILESNPAEKQYRIEHSVRVAKYSFIISEEEGFDSVPLALACLLHDVGYSVVAKGMPDYQKHGTFSANISKPLFEKMGFSGQILEDMLFAMAYHSKVWEGFPGTIKPFTKSVQDCDLIDRFDFYRTYKKLTAIKFEELSVAQRLDWLDKRLEEVEKRRSFPMGTETARKLFDEKLDFQSDLCNRIKNQLIQVSLC